MPWERLELSHPCGHMTLNHACLPIPAPGQISSLIYLKMGSGEICPADFLDYLCYLVYKSPS